MKILHLLLCVLLGTAIVSPVIDAETTMTIEKTDLFAPGDNNVNLFRIPGIVVTPKAQFWHIAKRGAVRKAIGAKLKCICGAVWMAAKRGCRFNISRTAGRACRCPKTASVKWQSQTTKLSTIRWQLLINQASCIFSIASIMRAAFT